jgi:hypothetical protein
VIVLGRQRPPRFGPGHEGQPAPVDHLLVVVGVVDRVALARVGAVAAGNQLGDDRLEDEHADHRQRAGQERAQGVAVGRDA